MFGWPYILDYICVINHHDALFILTSFSGHGWKGTFHPGPPTDDLEEKQYYLPHIHLLPPDDGLQMGPKHVEM
jgi:hypothetical protein